MKLFKQLLVAPAAIGLLAPLSASASEVDFDAISNYSNNDLEIDVNSFNQKSIKNDLLSGGEGLVDSSETIGGFSETTTASFGVDFLIGAADGSTDTEATTFSYQMGIGLETSFTGEDSLSATIDIGDAAGPIGTGNSTSNYDGLNFDSTENKLQLDGLTYTFPLGGATVMVGDQTDVSALYTGACAYSAFTDYMGNCGTGGSVGVGGNGVTATIGYAFDSGFSLAGGLSSSPTGIVTNDSDTYGIEAAYTADSYGVALAYVSADGGEDPETTSWGLNASYTPESTSLPSISVGYETEETGGTDASGYFVGLTWSEVGPGSLSVGGGTTQNFASGATETLTYEASYSYAINDGMTITPGVFITEVDGGDDLTGVAVLTSFSF